MNNKLIIFLLAVLLIALGLFAYFTTSSKMASSRTFEKEITKVETVSDSDSTESIEADLNSTDFDSLDSEITEIDAQLN